MEGLPTVCYSRGTMDSLLHKLTNLKNHSSSSPAKELSELVREVEELKRDFLDKIDSRREMHMQVTVWMKQVRDLVFDIEDWIDLKPDTNIVDPSDTEEIEYFKTEIREARERFTWYDLLEQVPTQNNLAVEESTTIDPLPFEDKTCRGVFGDSRDTLEKHLVDKQMRLKMVSVVGTEGLGKTTLAKEIYAELQLHGQFECQGFVSVGRRPAMREILNDIFRQVNPQTLSTTDQQSTVALREYLRTKRYFIVVDGIWSRWAWKVINCALPGNNLGSRVLTTTCVVDVGKFCSRHHCDVVYHMGALGEENSTTLFLSRIAPPEDERLADFKDVAGSIRNMCGDIPLAIIVASGLLARKFDNELVEWKMLAKSVLSSLKQSSTSQGMEKILQMSYADLSLPLRSCFLYLSVFSEDCTIKKDRLIWLWVAEGFIPRTDSECLWVTGERYFNELINRRLIQPVFDYDDDQAVGCTIHSVILDFIIALSRQENFATRATELSSAPFPCGTIRRFSLNNTSNEDGAGSLSRRTMHLSSMRALTVFGDIEGMFDPPLSLICEDDEEMHFCSVPTVTVSLSSFKLLRVLDLEDAKNLSNHHLEGIGGLVLLRYLGLRGTGISVLSEEIGEPEQLETLDFRQKQNKFVDTLAQYIDRFPKLVHLLGYIYARGIDRIVEMPQLEEVSTVDAWDRNSLDEVAELLSKSKRLRMLGVRLDISEEDNPMSFFEEVVNSNLHSLSLNCPDYADERARLLLDSWKKATAPPFVTFEPRRFELMFSGHSALSKLPPNMASLVGLTHLRMRITNVDAKDLDILGCLPNLVHLDLTSSFSSSKRLIMEKGAFPCLKVLLLKHEYSDRKGLEFHEGSVP